MRYAGKLPSVIEIGNNEDWADAIEFVDSAGAEVEIGDATLSIGLRGKFSRTSFLFDQDWITIEGNTASFVVPAATMAGLAPEDYELEVVSVGEVRRVTLRGYVRVLDGINPV